MGKGGVGFTWDGRKRWIRNNGGVHWIFCFHRLDSMVFFFELVFGFAEGF